MLSKTAILIPSCDKYSDLWRPFFHIFWQQWPDCPFPIYLGSNEKTWPDTRIQCLSIGPDKSWCANLHDFLDNIEAKRIIIFLDDFFLIRPIETAAVERMVRIAVEYNLGCLRLRPAPPPSKPLHGKENLGVVLRGEPYRVSTQVAIWDVEFLRLLAHPSFNIWEFEHKGTLIGDRLPKEVWAVYDPVIDYRHGVERGRWLEEGLAICREAGVEADITKRDCITQGELRQRHRKMNSGLRPRIASMLHPKLRRLIRRYIPRPGLQQHLIEPEK